MIEVEDRRGWHLDKSVSVAHIATTVALIITALWYLAAQDTRISNLELNVKHLEDQNSLDRGRIERRFDEVKTDLRAINAKLDRLVERESSGRRTP